MSSAELDIKNELLKRPAQSVADLFLSPFLDKATVLDLTHEDGPSLWMVNRSDVYTETLNVLAEHPIEGIRNRAIEKKAQRLGLQLTVLPEAPPFEIPKGPIAQDDIEEILGHPLAPFESMLFFARDLKEDSRASASLSLTRRLVEYPPNWIGNESIKSQLNEVFFELLKKDSSPFVRSFAARIPLFTESQIASAVQSEDHFFILGRIFQNPSFKGEAFLEFLNRLFQDSEFGTNFLLNSELEFPRSVLFLDSRLKTFELSKLKNKREAAIKTLNSQIERDLSDLILNYRIQS